MSEELSAIIAAVISGGFSLAGFIYGNHKSQSKTLYRLEQLEKKQDKHNTLIERMYRLEGDFKVMGEQVHNNEIRISKIEGVSPVNNYTNSM